MKKMGFGLMRLPLKEEGNPESIDLEQTKQMVDLFMEKGYNYYDTAFPYHNGKSEIAFKEAVSTRYPKDSYILADKLPVFNITKEE